MKYFPFFIGARKSQNLGINVYIPASFGAKFVIKISNHSFSIFHSTEIDNQDKTTKVTKLIKYKLHYKKIKLSNP